MTNPDDSRNWLEKARRDLLVIDRTSAGDGVPWDMVCFHAQQAVEKAFKACLIADAIDPPRTHDLLKLLDLLENAGVDFRSTRITCETLGNFAVQTRYPGDATEISETQGRWAAEKAHEIVAAVRELLGLPGTGGPTDA